MFSMRMNALISSWGISHVSVQLKADLSKTSVISMMGLEKVSKPLVFSST
jgi:hypothetical protein